MTHPIQTVNRILKKRSNKGPFAHFTTEHYAELYTYIADKKWRGKGIAFQILHLFLKSRVIYGWEHIYPSQQTLATKFGVSRESVNRAMQRLIVTGLVKRTYRTETSNEYELAPIFFNPLFRHLIKDLFPCLMGISLALLLSNPVAYVERPFSAFERPDQENVTLYKKGKEESKNESSERKDMQNFSAGESEGSSGEVYKESDSRKFGNSTTNLVTKQEFMADSRLSLLPDEIKERLWQAEYTKHQKQKEGTINAAYHTHLSRSPRVRSFHSTD